MKKYEYKKLITTKFFGARLDDQHRQIINEYAAKGYRYVGFIPTNMTEQGKIEAIDLIFEIEEE
jgi:hypothetical protein